MVAKTLAQLPFEHLPGGAQRNCIDESDVVRYLPPGYFASEVRQQLFSTYGLTALSNDDQQRAFTKLC